MLYRSRNHAQAASRISIESLHANPHAILCVTMSGETNVSQEGASRRFYELDSLRGLAAITVVFDHFIRIWPPEIIHVLDRTPLRLLIAGRQAVILFFLLSGFVFTLPHKRNSPLNYGRFLLKRVRRIYLPYLGALAFAIICDSHFSGRGHLGNYWINLTWSAPVTMILPPPNVSHS
jgi:peptidoglycan/LPS O-acetylase OafA/YrhL